MFFALLDLLPEPLDRETIRLRTLQEAAVAPENVVWTVLCCTMELCECCISIKYAPVVMSGSHPRRLEGLDWTHPLMRK